MITEKRMLSSDTLVRVCKCHDWYTKGSNSDYEDLVKKCYVDLGCRANITTEKLAEIAEDIIAHSEMDADWSITRVMYELNLNCVVIFEEE